MVFSCYSHEFLAMPKFWVIFLHPTSPSQPISQKNPAHQAHANYSLHVHLFSWILSFTCLIFLIGVTLEILWSVTYHLHHWQSDHLEKWCHWWNGSQRRVILEACKVAMFFKRTVSRFGQYGSNFFQRGRSIIFLFFSVDSDCTHWGLSKNDFFEILLIFLGVRQNFGLFFWQIFTFGKLAHTIQKIYSISASYDGFWTFKKSLPVSINWSTNLLTLVVRNHFSHPLTTDY